MNDSDILIMHLANKSFKVGELFRVDIEIVESSAPPRIYINGAYSNISAAVSID